MTSEAEFEILCIGNALVDVFAEDDEQLHLRFGITEPVQHVEIDKITSILSALPVYNAVSGGGAANVAKIAAFLGAKTYFTGAIGAGKIGGVAVGGVEPDHFGRLFEKDLAATGVKLALRQKSLPTGICLMLKTGDGKTRIAASPSASLELSESDISEEDIKKAKIVLIDGFMLGRPGLVSHIISKADLYKKVIAIDLSAPFIAKEYAEELTNYARLYPLILFMNEAEAEAFYSELKKKYPTSRITQIIYKILNHRVSRSDPRSFAEKFSKTMLNSVFLRGVMFPFRRRLRKFPIVVVKLGERGAVCFAGGEICKSETKAITPLETTGAGDAFCAGFLTAWVRNKPLSECAALGNKTAALVLGVEGSQIKNSGPLEPLFVE